MDEQTEQDQPSSVPAKRPARGSGPVQVHITPGPTPAQAVVAAIAADPCGVLGHRPAWLARGGVACGRCGVPL